MPGAVAELKIGPFSGGINQFSDKSAIADNEMEDCVNFDIDLDGSLKSRPPWSLLYSREDTVSTGLSAPYRTVILGTYVYNGVQFIVFINRYTTGESSSVFYFYYINGPNAGTTLSINPTIPIAFSTSIRYENTLYLIPDPTVGSTSGVSYALDTGVVTEIATMPKGNTAIVYKDTLYIGGGRDSVHTANRSRISFSALANFASWPASNFFDINPGDGDAVQDFLVYQDNILIAKDNATYVLAYDTSPAQAVLKVVNNNIGVKGPYCMVPYENSVFFMHYASVYEMVNYDFTRVSTKIPFVLDQSISNPYTFANLSWSTPIYLRRVGDRLVARFYNNIYVYHLRVRAWTRWDSLDVNIKYMGPPFELDRTNSSTVQAWENFVASTSLSKQVDAKGPGDAAGGYKLYPKIFLFTDTYSSTTLENGNIVPAVPPVDIKCFFQTKVYDIGVSSRFKRLLHWGVDMVTARDVTGTLYPLSMSYRVTWNSLHTLTWSQLNTWGYPTFTIPTTTQVTPIINRVDRRFIRFPKSLRFRLLQFKIEVATQGNTTDGPARVYNIAAFISSKQLVPSAVN